MPVPGWANLKMMFNFNHNIGGVITKYSCGGTTNIIVVAPKQIIVVAPTIFSGVTTKLLWHQQEIVVKL